MRPLLPNILAVRGSSGAQSGYHQRERLGHPVGSTGCRIMVTLLYAMKHHRKPGHALRGGSLSMVCVPGDGVAREEVAVNIPLCAPRNHWGMLTDIHHPKRFPS